MSEAESARLGIGGNNPPSPLTPNEVAAFLSDTQAALLKRRDDLLAGVARFKAAFPTIEDEETQGKAGDFVKQIAAAIKQSRDAFTVAKRPFLEGGRAVDAFFKSLEQPLESGMAEVRKPMTAYALKLEEQERARRAEAARLAREEADRLQQALAYQRRREALILQEEEAARQRVIDEAGPKRLSRQEQEMLEQQELAARPSPAPAVSIEQTIAALSEADKAERAALAKPADLSRNRGDFGSVSSLREVWEVELEDISLVPLEYLIFDQAKAKKAAAAGVRQIPGCRVFSGKHIQTR